MDCDFSPSSPHLLPNGLFSPQNRISFELLALSGLLGFSTFKGGKMLIFQGFANSRIVREFPPFSFKVRIATLTRNQFASNRTWVRIPSSPPKSPVNSRVFWTFPFSRQGVDLAKNAGNPALFRLFFARLLEPAMSEKPYISRLFGVALIFLQELCLPALTFGVRKRKNIVHNIRGSDLGLVIQMAVNIRRRANIAVTQPLLNLLQRHIVRQKQ